MKVRLEFDLPEDKEELNTAQNAGKYVSALDEIHMMVRSVLKYEDTTGWPERSIEILESVRQLSGVIHGD